MHTKVTQYFTDDNSAAGYSHVLTQPTESFCGTAFNYEHIYSSSLANGKWRDCLYGPYTFCSGSTTGSACASGNCGQFYIDTAAITIDYTGKLGDTTSNITLYTGSRLYLSSSLELAPDGYYTSGGIYYKVGKGDCCGWNDGTFISSGSCPTAPSASWNCVSGSCVDPGITVLSRIRASKVCRRFLNTIYVELNPAICISQIGIYCNNYMIPSRRVSKNSCCAYIPVITNS
jgi:hypothetical protein